MNMSEIYGTNHKLVLKRVAAATDGISTKQIVKKTGLCLRTVQTHLRALRSEGRIFNQSGLWKTPNF